MPFLNAGFSRWFVALALCACLAGLANAGVVAARSSGTVPGSVSLSNPEAVSWTYDHYLANLKVTVYQINNTSAANEYIVLSLAQGLGATAIATSIPYQVNAGATIDLPQWDLGGVSLGPGTTYLQVLACTDSENPLSCLPGSASGNWLVGGSIQPSTVGATFGAEYWSDGTSWYSGETLGGFEVLGDSFVPEPATWALLGMGLALAGLMRRRRV